MIRRYVRASLRLTLGALACASLTASGPCEHKHPTGPGGGSTPGLRTMSNCWPNDDGLSWTYGLAFQANGEVVWRYFRDSSSVPVVSLDAVVAHLALEPDTLPSLPAQGLFSLRFMGDTTTWSGVRAQNLRESYPGSSLAPPDWRAGFLQGLSRARPDLRQRLARLGVQATTSSDPWIRPYYVHGYAWRKTAERIGTYGDVDQVLAWQFLEQDIRIGHTFTFRLVPSLATDVFLKAKVTRTRTVDLPGGGRTSNALEVVYLTDYGISTWTDVSGQPIGYGRMIDFGRVIYVPGVGPLFDEEHGMANVTETGFDDGNYRLTLSLAATGAAPAFASR